LWLCLCGRSAAEYEQKKYDKIETLHEVLPRNSGSNRQRQRTASLLWGKGPKAWTATWRLRVDKSVYQRSGILPGGGNNEP